MCRLTFIACATLHPLSALLALNSKKPLSSPFRSPAFSPEPPVVPLRIYDFLPLACRQLRRWTRCPSSGTSRSEDQIVRVGNEFRFGLEYAFPCSAETAYRSKQGSLYTLETLVFFVRHHHLKHTGNLQSARSLRLPAVTLRDHNPSSAAPPLPTPSNSFPPLPPPTTLKSAAHDVEEYRPDDPSFLSSDPNSAAADQSKFPDEPDASVFDDRRSLEYLAMIRALERPLKDREAILECSNRDFYDVLVASTRREEERQ